LRSEPVIGIIGLLTGFSGNFLFLGVSKWRDFLGFGDILSGSKKKRLYSSFQFQKQMKKIQN
jgi:hypothetical protein